MTFHVEHPLFVLALPLASLDATPVELAGRMYRPDGPGKDGFATLGWLAARKDVDPGRICLVGWSNGATAGGNPEARRKAIERVTAFIESR